MDNKQINNIGDLSRVAQIIELETEIPRKIMIEVNVRDIGEKEGPGDGRRRPPSRSEKKSSQNQAAVSVPKKTNKPPAEPNKARSDDNDDCSLEPSGSGYEESKSNGKQPRDEGSDEQGNLPSTAGSYDQDEEEMGGILPKAVKEFPDMNKPLPVAEPEYGSGKYGQPPPVTFPEEDKKKKKKKEELDLCEIKGYGEARGLKRKKGENPCLMKNDDDKKKKKVNNQKSQKEPPPPPTPPPSPPPPPNPPQTGQRSNSRKVSKDCVPTSYQPSPVANQAPQSPLAASMSNEQKCELANEDAIAIVREQCQHKGRSQFVAKRLHGDDSMDQLGGVPKYLYHIDDESNSKKSTAGGSTVVYIVTQSTKEGEGLRGRSTHIQANQIANTRDRHSLGECSHGKYDEPEEDDNKHKFPGLYFRNSQTVQQQVTESEQFRSRGSKLFKDDNYLLGPRVWSEFSSPMTLANDEMRQIEVCDLAYDDDDDDGSETELDNNFPTDDEDDDSKDEGYESQADFYIPLRDATSSYVFVNNNEAQQNNSEQMGVTRFLFKMGSWMKNTIFPDYGRNR